MREIKFRAWSITNQRWTYFGIKDAPAWVDKAELEQFTGLHDKRGKEIYEGDIVKWGHLGGWYTENPARIAVVVINPDIQFDCINLKHTFHYGQFAYKDTHNALEIIGNKWENPELRP